mmetsp:Transcript_52367/g.109238  ORF Transcript_52367/g.109238 Transcript_52367/m.109238 type:complete len:504 (+) Transcript_52367:153-1664(+)
MAGHGCPFMAIYDATQAAKAGKDIPLTCPFSGNRAGVLTSVGVSGHSFGAYDETDFSDSWRQTGNSHHLGVIREDAEMDMRDSMQDSMEEESNPGQKDEGSPHQSRAGSLAGSMRSLGSLASGINANVPAGSRISGSHAGTSKSGSSKSKRKKKRGIVPRMRDVTRTPAPTYSIAQLREYAPPIRKSWGLLLAHVPWDQLGARLYEAIFTVAPVLQGMFSKSSVAMGIKMVDMIDSMVNSLDDMDAVHRKMEGLGPLHHRNSVHAYEHMPIFETVVVALLEQVLEKLFTAEMREAWHWLWEWLTESMHVVGEAYNTSSSMIQQSWDAVTESTTLSGIGSCIYETLFEIAPNLRHLFSKPKEIMALKLVNIVAMLVSLSSHPETVDGVIRDLGKKHVTYGVASHHVPVMKQAILAVLERLLGDSWTSETSKAWVELWDLSAAAMMKSIDAGRDHGSVMESIWQRYSDPPVSSQRWHTTLLWLDVPLLSPPQFAPTSSYSDSRPC